MPKFTSRNNPSRKAARRSAPKTRTRTRTVVKYRNRTKTKIVRVGARGGSLLPFREGGGLVRSVKSSALPVAKKLFAPVVGAGLAYYAAPRLAARLGASPVKVGAALLVVGLVLGTQSKRIARLVKVVAPATIKGVAAGVLLDGAMRASYPLRVKGHVLAQNVGLLAGVPSVAADHRLAGVRGGVMAGYATPASAFLND